MSASKGMQLCVIVTLAAIHVQLLGVIATTDPYECGLLCPRLQVIVAGEPVHYSVHDLSLGSTLDPHWCIDGVRANFEDKFNNKFPFQLGDRNLTYLNPQTNDRANGLLLYLVNRLTDNVDCPNIFSAIDIHSATGGITARVILLHVVEAISCPEFPYPLNGQVNNTLTMENGRKVQTASFSCDIGYYLSGKDFLRCERDGNELIGQWSSEAPTCEPVKCDKQTDILNGTVKYRSCDITSEPLANIDLEQVPYGTVVSYSCQPGYALTDGNSTQTCQLSDDHEGNNTGVWSGVKPNCRRVTCRGIEQPRNGTITYWDSTDVRVVSTREDFDVGTIAKYSCEWGYKVDNEQKLIKTCQENGQWNGGNIKCTAIACPDLEEPLNGLVSHDDEVISSVATYTCVEGYSIYEGNTQRTCILGNNKAVWDGKPPICLKLPNGVVDAQQFNGTCPVCQTQTSVVAIIVPVVILFIVIVIAAVVLIVLRSKLKKKSYSVSCEKVSATEDADTSANTQQLQTITSTPQ